MTAPAVPAAPNVTYAAPITIIKGGTYAGNWQGVTIATTEPVVLEGCNLKGTGRALILASVAGFDLTVRGCYLDGTGSTGETRAAALAGAKRLIVDGCDIVNTAGIYLQNAAPTEIKIRRNRVRDVQTKGTGLVQAVQFDKVVGGDVEIAWNEIVNRPGVSNVEDVISFYASGGTPAVPWSCHDNLIWGAFPNPATNGFSGGGIMHGDAGGGWCNTTGNVVLGTTNYGIAISGGTGWKVTGNRVISAGVTAAGVKLPAVNVGLYMWASSGPVTSSVMGSNVVGWWRASASVRNDWWLPALADSPSNTAPGNVSLAAGAISYSGEQDEYDGWLARVAENAITLGRLDPLAALQAKYDAVVAELLAGRAANADLTDQVAVERRRRAALIAAIDQAIKPFR